MTTLTEGGISIDLLPAWDAQIRAAGQSFAASGAAPSLSEGLVLHAASFSLPPERGDYGSGAVELMGGSDVLVCLLEHPSDDAATPLFAAEGIPRLEPGMFSPQSMQRAVAGMAGMQHFFQVRGRPFCLYVVVGSARTSGPLVRLADRVTSTIRISV